jgi:3-deoxy-manno-octulosonate cytidylyltransferase (CMP-KDO synthetase)
MGIFISRLNKIYLRFFDLNIPIKMVETSGSSLAVDVIEDISKVEAELIKFEIKV